jgi:hypothetical protein
MEDHHLLHLKKVAAEYYNSCDATYNLIQLLTPTSAEYYDHVEHLKKIQHYLNATLARIEIMERSILTFT